LRRQYHIGKEYVDKKLRIAVAGWRVMAETQTGIPCRSGWRVLYLSPNSAEVGFAAFAGYRCPTNEVTLVEEEQEIDIEPGLERLSKRWV